MGAADTPQDESVPRFARPPQAHLAAALLSKALTLLLALFVLYHAANWWFATHTKQPQQQQQPPQQPTTLPLPQPAPAPQAAPQAVTKCIAKGKTTYSDGACPPGSTASTVTIDPRVNVVETSRPAAAAMPAYKPAAVVAQTPTSEPMLRAAQATNTDTARKTECEVLSALVEQLDMWARQPQSAQRQDWIREERRNARDRQGRIRC